MNIFRGCVHVCVHIEPGQHRSGLFHVHTTRLSRSSGRCAVHTTWLSSGWESCGLWQECSLYTILRKQVWLTALLGSPNKLLYQKLMQEMPQEMCERNAWAAVFHHKHSAERRPPAHLCATDAVLLFIILQQLLRLLWSGCRRGGEQTPAGNQPNGLKSCSVNKAWGTTLNVLRWPTKNAHSTVYTYFSSITVCPLLFISSTMIFSSSGSRTWGTHSFRTAAHRLPGSLDLCLRELGGLSDETPNQTNLWCFGADWHLCSKPRSPSVSGHLPPEQLCLQRVANYLKMARYQYARNCMKTLFWDDRKSIMQDAHKFIIGITKWRLFCFIYEMKGLQRPQV